MAFFLAYHLLFIDPFFQTLFTNVPHPDLNLLRIFDMVISTGAVSQAAEQLGMTPPAVSQALSRLSRQMGQPLFVRQGRGIKPTAAAISLRQQITPHLSILEQSITLDADFDPALSHRVFCIGSDQNYDLLYIRHTYSLLSEEAPKASFEWVPCLYQEEERHDALRSRRVDVIITSLPLKSPGFYDEEVAQDHIVAACARNHPRIGTVGEFDGFFAESHTALSRYRMNDLFMDSLALETLPARKIVYRNDSLLTLMAMAASTDWLCICPKKIAEEYTGALGLHVFTLPFKIQPFPVYLSWHSSREGDAGLLWLRDKIKAGFTLD
ncbi:LysR family transcriptional regulator [Endozoicomonas lisbonensis]|uniref:LysR family transcriptional activator for leuABCD operon n=2 Tax=Endozoicomonas lisbonensis TaxID=3120522 RepID=A0ABV2SIW3_9GAMM